MENETTNAHAEAPAINGGAKESNVEVEREVNAEVVQESNADVSVEIKLDATGEDLQPSEEKSAVINKDVKKTTLKKNNVQLIHEIDNSINFQTKQVIDEEGLSCYEMNATFDNQLFVGSGKSKKKAKLDLANKMIEIMKTRQGTDKVDVLRKVKKTPMKAKGRRSVVKIEHMTSKDKVRMSYANGAKILNDFMIDATYVYESTLQADEPNGPGKQFKVTLTCLKDKVTEVFQAEGSNKKHAKNMAAQQACSSLLGIMFTDNRSAINAANAEVNKSIQTQVTSMFANQVAVLVRQKMEDVFNASDMRKELPKFEKVFSGVVVKHAAATETDTPRLEVVALAAGSKCINGSNLTYTGDSINDCHAEILCGRALRVYLYHQILAFYSDTDSIFEWTDDTHTRLSIKSDVTFHLYINTAPCGDSRIFSSSDSANGVNVEQSQDSHPLRISRGMLRTKIEGGEGTVLVNNFYEHEGVGQTFDGVMGGQRLRTMSCSDKLAKWIILGVQGALLSTIIDPLYFTSVTVSNMYNLGHFKRALHDRLDGIDSLLSEPYRRHLPDFAVSKRLRRSRSYSNHSHQAFNWMYEGGCPTTTTTGVEVLLAKSGKTLEGAASRLCKLRLLEMYLATCHVIKAGSAVSSAAAYSYNIGDLVAGAKLHALLGGAEVCYRDIKDLAVKYAASRTAMVAAFTNAGLGRWLRKPDEVDFFEAANPSSDPGVTPAAQ